MKHVGVCRHYFFEAESNISSVALLPNQIQIEYESNICTNICYFCQYSCKKLKRLRYDIVL